MGALSGLILAAGCQSGGRPGTGVVDGGSSTDQTTDDSGSNEAGDVAGEGPVPYSLCDGMFHPRFRAAYEGGGPEFMGSYVRVEAGYQYFLVDGVCRFYIGGAWVNESLSRDRPVWGGVLDPAEVMELEAALPLGRLAELADCTGATPADSGQRALYVEGASARCNGVSGKRFDPAWASLSDFIRRLRDRINPNDGVLRVGDGPIHVSVVPTDPPVGSSPMPYMWTLTATLESFFVDLSAGSPVGRSHLLTNLQDSATLHLIWYRYLMARDAMPGPYLNWDGLRVVTPAGQQAYVFMRDALPYEDERGLIAF